MNQQTSTGPGTSSVVIEPELKYYRVRTEIETILSGLDEGDSVPSERELAARFTVARETVRQALRDLLVEGRIERRGRGTVVASPKLVQPLSIRSYTEGALSAGRVPSRKVATELGIELGDSVVHLERVLFADGEKIGLESTFLPDSRFGEMLDAFDATTSLYAAIRSIGVVFASATERIETVLASPREATLVESTTSMPMLLLHRTSVDPEGVPIERVRSLYRGDRIAFLTTLRE